MEEFFTRVMHNLLARLSGPLQFRLLIQPGMATLFALRAGLIDALEKRPAFFWSIFTDAEQRTSLLREGWKAVGKVFIIAIVVDGVYQFIAVQWFYPGEALIVAFMLAVVPYLLIRGPFNRLVRLIRF
jgi:hypothetical protein